MLPFGVTNGPSYFQEFMLTLYGGSKHGPDMLGESMSDLGATMEVWIDDVQLGSGSLTDGPARERGDLDSSAEPDGFDQHLEALGRVLKRVRPWQTCVSSLTSVTLRNLLWRLLAWLLEVES